MKKTGNPKTRYTPAVRRKLRKAICDFHVRAFGEEMARVNRLPLAASFRNADELEALLLQAGPATPMTAARKARIYGNVNWRQEPERFF
jgi:hypothetical protein